MSVQSSCIKILFMDERLRCRRYLKCCDSPNFRDSRRSVGGARFAGIPDRGRYLGSFESSIAGFPGLQLRLVILSCHDFYNTPPLLI